MDSIIDELARLARRCENAHLRFEDADVKAVSERIASASQSLAAAWSGSCIGFHAGIYIEGLRPKGPGEHFDSEWGGLGVSSSRSRGPWREYTYEAVESELLRRAGLPDLVLLERVAEEAEQTFEDAKSELVPTLDALIAHQSDRLLEDARRKIYEQSSHISQNDFAAELIPRGEYFTRDRMAVSQGMQLPHHARLLVRVFELTSYGHAVKAIAQQTRYVIKYLEQRRKMTGMSAGKTRGRIFIGHGGSPAWRDLKDFLQDRLHLEWDEFNREPTPGMSTKERLESMLDAASFAFLVMTAEDEHADGGIHARANVVHEAGLFQGRLGFQRAIVLLEDGCNEFSNIVGLVQIRFPKGNILAKSEDVRRVLEREGILHA